VARQGIPCGPLQIVKIKQNIPKKVKLLQNTILINL